MIQKPIAFCFSILSLLTGLAGQAQTGKHGLSGLVKDSTSKPMPFVTIELLAGSGSAPSKTTYTNDKGHFSFTDLDTGRYTLVLSHTGFADLRKEVAIGDGQTLELPELLLLPAPHALKGVVITARKPLVEQTDDKIIFNVENDPATKTETAIDILRKTPFVSVDGDNNIQVNGQTNFKVLLNGRETAMFAQNVKEALKGFPGALIVRIEVITSPSAKYDAEGVGGIINIITKKRVAGYNGSINNYYSSTGNYNVNTNFSAKLGKVGMTLFDGLNGSSNMRGRSTKETLPFTSNSVFSRRLLDGDVVANSLWNFGNAEVSWEVDSLNTLSLYGNMSGGHGRNELHQTITTSYPNGIDSIGYYDLYNRNGFPTYSIGTDYIKKYSSNKDREFSIRLNSEFSKSNTYLNSEMDNPAASDRFVINNSQAQNRQYTIQSDYIHPLNKGRKLESGVKGIFRRATSDFEGLVRIDPYEEYKQNPSNTDYFRYNQEVYSAYSSYSFKTGKTGFRLGGRLEHTEVNGNFVSAKTSVRQSYTNLLPNLQATTKLNDALTLVVSYNDRLQRPSINNLNPFRNDNDPRIINYGNPTLDAQVIHSLSVQTRLMKGTTFIGVTFTGSYSNNMIVQYSTFDAATGVTSSTSDNLGKELAIGASGNINAKLNKNWNVYINGGVRYSHVKNKLMPSQENSGFGGNANLNTNYQINKRFTTSGYVGFFRNPVGIQTRYPLNLWYGINAGYKLFNEKVTVSIGAANFLKKYWSYKLVTTDPAFRYTSITRMPFRGLSVSLGWNFGKLTENVSRKRGVTNDDALGGSGRS